jgi:hypothetical protein
METRRWQTLAKRACEQCQWKVFDCAGIAKKVSKVLSKGTPSTSFLASVAQPDCVDFLERRDRSSIKPGFHHPISDYWPGFSPNSSQNVQAFGPPQVLIQLENGLRPPISTHLVSCSPGTHMDPPPPLPIRPVVKSIVDRSHKYALSSTLFMREVKHPASPLSLYCLRG